MQIRVVVNVWSDCEPRRQLLNVFKVFVIVGVRIDDGRFQQDVELIDGKPILRGDLLSQVADRFVDAQRDVVVGFIVGVHAVDDSELVGLDSNDV